MRISDWSSDVCSSDLARPGARRGLRQHGPAQPGGAGLGARSADAGGAAVRQVAIHGHREGNPRRRTRPQSAEPGQRSEERRVGKSVSVRVDLGGRRNIKKKKEKQLIAKTTTRK